MVGTGKNLENIKKEVKAKQLKNVYFIGPISNPFDYYQAMDVFVLPSLYEGLPVVGVEAQANGLKCFFSQEITKEAMILKQTEYLSIKTNPKSWADRIKNYLDNRKNLRNATDALESYDIKTIASNMLETYKKYLNSL